MVCLFIGTIFSMFALVPQFFPDHLNILLVWFFYLVCWNMQYLELLRGIAIFFTCMFGCSWLIWSYCYGYPATFFFFEAVGTVSTKSIFSGSQTNPIHWKNRICRTHTKQALDLYCKTCSIICQDWTLKDHPREEHDFDFIGNVVGKIKREDKTTHSITETVVRASEK